MSLIDYPPTYSNNTQFVPSLINLKNGNEDDNEQEVKLLKKRYPVIYSRLEQLFHLYLQGPSYSHVFDEIGILSRPVSILLCGPSGTGKSMLIHHFLKRFQIDSKLLHVGQLQCTHSHTLSHGLTHFFYDCEKKHQMVVIERIDLFATIPDLYLALQQSLSKWKGMSLCTAHDIVPIQSLPFTDVIVLGSPALPPPQFSLSFKDVIGMETIKTRLLQSRHTLLYGPPGTGKTMLATCLASEFQGHFFPLRLSEVMSCYVGVTEQTLADLFLKAKEVGPSILFLDELDALCPSRDTNTTSCMGRKIITQLALELDAVPKTTRVIAATNRPWMIDPSLLRSGRIDVHLYIGPPSFHDRELFLNHFLATTTTTTSTTTTSSSTSSLDSSLVIHTNPLQSTEHILLKLKEEKEETKKRTILECTEGWSSADFKALLRKSINIAEQHQEKKQVKLQCEDILEALHTLKPSISKQELIQLETWSAFQ